MTIFWSASDPRDPPRSWTGFSSGVSRSALIVFIIVAGAAGYFATDAADGARAVSSAGDDLTRLLRMMAALKAVMALGAGAAVLWRLGSPVSFGWLVAYAVACAAMSAGPGLIWTMAHVGLGATLLHGGLAATILLLWRDPVVSGRLANIIAARRARLRRSP